MDGRYGFSIVPDVNLTQYVQKVLNFLPVSVLRAHYRTLLLTSDLHGVLQA